MNRPYPQMQMAVRVNRSHTFVTPILLMFVLLLVAGSAGCGYHVAGSGKSSRLPTDLHTIAIPPFKNNTSAYHAEQVLTQAVVREFLARTRYRVVSNDSGNADAVLRGTVLSVSVSPATTDSVTGRVSTALVVLTVGVALTDQHAKVLYQNPSYTFLEQYQISRDPASFFQEEAPAVDRMARDFARTLVNNILEAY